MASGTSSTTAGAPSSSSRSYEAPAKAVAPIDAPDLVELVDGSADDAIVSVETEFLDRYDIVGEPAYALESLASDLTDVSDQLNQSLASVVKLTQELALVNSTLTIISQTASTLVATPANIVSSLVEAFDAIAQTTADAPLEVAAALVDAYATPGQPQAVGTSATRTTERANQTALSDILRRVLLIQAVRVLSTGEFESVSQATERRDELVDLIDDQSQTAGDDSYLALTDLRSSLINAVPGDAELARVLDVERRLPVPSILLSYQVYGTVDKELDIVARNTIEHPGFIRGTVQVLNG